PVRRPERPGFTGQRRPAQQPRCLPAPRGAGYGPACLLPAGQIEGGERVMKQRVMSLVRDHVIPASHEPVVRWMAFLSVFIVAGVGAAVVVFTQGLGVTNLTDLVPWGLWISIDLSAIALAAGAFSVSAIAYLLRKKELQPVAKTAVFVGF